jgi:predicted alpha/beta-fold hydrolase
MLTAYSFRPALFFRNAHVQTVLASVKIRALGANPMVAAAEKIILNIDGVRLLGSISLQKHRSPKGLVILLHGWEGSMNSTYILQTGRSFYENGYAVFRLNFRDHGDSHHLNSGIFYATLLEEVFQAAKQAAERFKDYPAFLVGFSLGGNFALRMARRTAMDPIENLKHVVSISPVLDPQKATDGIENSYYIHRYFLNKWRRSLTKKQKLFPDKYDFSPILALNSIRKITDALIERYSNLGSTDDYFKGYAISSHDLKDIALPVTLLIAEDDPIIPFDDFRQLQLNHNINLVAQHFGGHNGFVDGLRLRGWYESTLLSLFNDISRCSR